MNIFTKALNAMRHSAGASAFWTQRLLKRTRIDYRKEVGNGLDSSVVTAPIMWMQRAFPEARIAIQQRKRDGEVSDLVDHEMLALIQRPNDHYGDIALWAGTILSWYTGGNAYWLKVRNSYSKVVELWWVPHWTMEPKWPQDGSAFISHYEYKPGGGVAPMDIDFDDVIHFRHGIDPNNPRKGLPPLDGCIREIFMDLESSNFVSALLNNSGVPGVVIAPKNGAVVAPTDVQATKTYVDENFGGDRRGSTMVMGAPTEVHQFGFNPQQMNMSEARDIAEERVSACIGIPGAVVGFGAGLQTAKVGATMEELRKIAWHNGVLPLGRALLDELKRSLLPDFEKNIAGLDLVMNTDDVPALQEDEDKQTERWNKRLTSGAVTVWDYRNALGLKADDSHKIYLRGINLIEVPEGAPPRQLPAPAGPALLPAPKSIGAKAMASTSAIARGAAYVTMLQRQERGLQEAFEPRLRAFFARLGQAVHDAALPLLEQSEPKAEKADESLIAMVLEKLGLPAWAAELRQAYGAHYLEVDKSVAEAGELAGLGTSLPDPVGRAIIASGGRRADMLDLDAQTHEALSDALAEGRAEGEGAAALAKRIVPIVERGPWRSPEMRARIIARTETKYAQNISTIERAKAAGVTSFIIFDGRLGPGRSTPSHIERNGNIVTAIEADRLAEAEHPNGTLSFAPHFEEED